MSRFIFGDDLGNIKVLRYDSAASDGKTKITTIRSEVVEKRAGIQAISARPGSTSTIFATATSNGSLALHELSGNELDTVCKWSEPRLKDNQFVGLAATASAIFSCTSNGALRRATFSKGSTSPTQQDKASLPTRLQDWRLSPDSQSFAYGGEEVGVSVWNTEQAFQASHTREAPPLGKKRRRSEVLFAGEIWRARNVSNDSLNLRQPVRVTSLSFLPWSGSNGQVVTGTLANNVRRYDIRAARRPVADWKNVGKVGGIKTLEAGLREHELFVSDHGTNLFAIDMRNGRTLYSYQGISGAITSIAPSPSVMASTSLDRFVRTHDTIPLAHDAGARLQKKGSVLDKTYANCIPTCVVWDRDIPSPKAVDSPEQEDLVWDALEQASDGDEIEEPVVKRRHVK